MSAPKSEGKNWYDVAGEHMRSLGFSENWTNRAVVAAALRNGVTVTKSDTRERVILSYNGRQHWWRDGLSSLNTRLAMRVCKNKDVLSALLSAEGLPVMKNQVFSAEDAERAWAWGSRLDSLVVKPADGTGGASVFTDIKTRHEFDQAFLTVAAHFGRVLVEEFRAGVEYRFLTVRNRVIAVAQRKPAHVLGDGRRTIEQLVDEKNEQRWRAPSHKLLRLGEHERNYLRKQGLTPSTVPENEERIYLRATSNIHTGGDAIDVTSTIDPEYIAAVEAAARAIPGGVILGFDILIPEAADDERIGIIEINTGPMISMHHLPWEGECRDVGEAIVQAMYSDLREGRDLDDWVEPFKASARASEDLRPPIGKVRRKIRRAIGQIVGAYKR